MPRIRHVWAASVLLGFATTTWVPAQCFWQKVSPTGGSGPALFGRAMDASGSTAIVGAPQDYGSGPSAGAAYVLRRDIGGWAQAQKLTASDGRPQSWFGNAIGISGTTAVIGSMWNTNQNGVSAGAAYVFEEIGGVWTETAKLLAPDGQPSDLFGYSVAIEGDRLVVGAIGGNAGPLDTGAAYVFERGSSGWGFTDKLLASDGAVLDRFGVAVTVEGDTVVVGAYWDDDLGIDSGSAYAFQKGSSGWTEVAKLLASDGAAGDWFGLRVSLCAGRVLVGAYQDTNQNGAKAGGAYVFDSAASWSETAKLLPADGMPYANFGIACQLSPAGALVGAAYHDEAGVREAGTAYFFEMQGSAWVETTKYAGVPPTSRAHLGSSVAMVGNEVLAGATGDASAGWLSGAVSVFATKSGAFLTAEPASVPLGAGGCQPMRLRTCPRQPGAVYLLLGSLTGTSPGFDYRGTNIPLNPDPYFQLTATNPNMPPLSSSWGALSARGKASAQFCVPAGFMPALAGVTLHHAFVVIDTTTLSLVTVSNPAPLLLTP